MHSRRYLLPHIVIPPDTYHVVIPLSIGVCLLFVHSIAALLPALDNSCAVLLCVSRRLRCVCTVLRCSFSALQFSFWFASHVSFLFTLISYVFVLYRSVRCLVRSFTVLRCAFERFRSAFHAYCVTHFARRTHCLFLDFCHCTRVLRWSAVTRHTLRALPRACTRHVFAPLQKIALHCSLFVHIHSSFLHFSFVVVPLTATVRSIVLNNLLLHLFLCFLPRYACLYTWRLVNTAPVSDRVTFSQCITTTLVFATPLLFYVATQRAAAYIVAAVLTVKPPPASSTVSRSNMPAPRVIARRCRRHIHSPAPYSSAILRPHVPYTDRISSPLLIRLLTPARS